MITARPPREPAPMAPVTTAARLAPVDPVPQEHVLTLTPDPVTGLADFAMIIEVPAPAGGAPTFSDYREHPTLPLIARQEDFTSAAAAWAAVERFATCIVDSFAPCSLRYPRACVIDIDRDDTTWKHEMTPSPAPQRTDIAPGNRRPRGAPRAEPAVPHHADRAYFGRQLGPRIDGRPAAPRLYARPCGPRVQ